MNVRTKFEEFIMNNLDNAYRFALSYTKNKDVAEDVVNDSVVKALGSLWKMRNPEKMKDDYTSVKCSKKLEDRIIKTMKRKNTVCYLLTSLAAAAASLIIVLNAVPSISVAALEIPVVKQVVNVLTFGRFAIEDGGFSANIVTPEITGLMDEKLEKKLNAELKKNANAVKNQFLKDMADLKAAYGEENVHLDVKMNYIVKTDNEDYLALDVYIYTAVGSSSTRHTYYNIDKKNGTLLTLDDVYKNESGYKEILKNYIDGEMKRRNAEEEGMYFTIEDKLGGKYTESALENIDKFYINEDGKIVICFDKYEIAAGAQGCPEFEIPESILKPEI